MTLLYHSKFLRYVMKNIRFFKYINQFPRIHTEAVFNQIPEGVHEIDQKWEAVVGLEVHAQIESHSKLFSSSFVKFGSPTNTEVSYFDAALPGTLPVLNKHCVESAILTALALNCTINKFSTFDRKHYFYPDLPAGYQITQQFHPLAVNGFIKFVVPQSDGEKTSYEYSSKIKQIQLEQDSGRSIHMKEGTSYVDLNRAGVALMEIVFDPDLKNGREAAALIEELICVLKKIKTCSCHMEEGTLRVDANISVNRKNEALGVRTEVKNLNSLRYIAQAIDYEIERQKQVLEKGGTVLNETRGFDYKTKTTVYLRDKEVLQDYRFLPEPNLPPIIIYENEKEHHESNSCALYLDEIKSRIPNLPDADRQHMLTNYKLTLEEVNKILNGGSSKEMFEYIALKVDDHSYICEFLFNPVQHQLNAKKMSFEDCLVNRERLSELVELVHLKTISEATANDILEMLFNGDERKPSKIVETYNWYQICDGKELEKFCLQAMADRSKMVKKFRKSGQRRYMTSLLHGLNLIVNNRACIRDAENVFQRLMNQKLKIK